MCFPVPMSNRMREGGSHPALGSLNLIFIFFFFIFAFLFIYPQIRTCTWLGKNTSNLKDLKSLLDFHHPTVTAFSSTSNHLKMVPVLERAGQGERYRGSENFTCISYFLGIGTKQKHQSLALARTVSTLSLLHTDVLPFHPRAGCLVFLNRTNKFTPHLRHCDQKASSDPSLCVSYFLLMVRQRDCFLNTSDNYPTASECSLTSTGVPDVQSSIRV